MSPLYQDMCVRYSFTVAKVIERLGARYEIQELNFGKVYKWCPEKAPPISEKEECR